MLLGGFAELIFGVRAERQSLENIARPLTAEEADAATPQEQESYRQAELERELSPDDRRLVAERDRRARERTARRRERETKGPQRFRPGPGGSQTYSPGMMGTTGTPSRSKAAAERDLDREIDDLARATEEGPVERRDLAERVGARGWGPGRFRRALTEATKEGRLLRLPHNRYGSGRDGE